MDGNAPKVPIPQEAQPEVKGVSQTPLQPSIDSLTPTKPTPPTKPKKGLKLIIPIILIALASLIVGGFFVWKYFFASGTSVPLLDKIVNQKTKEEVEIYKGVWMPTIYFQDENYIELNAQRLKDIGINTIFFQASPPQPEQWLDKTEDNLPSEILEKLREILPVEKELIINITQQAHRNGFKVALTMSNLPDMEGIDVDLLNSRIVEYALLAEEHGIELFAPMNEPGVIFHPNTGKWRREILPKIKNVYHGDILWKGTGLGLPDEPLTEEFFKEISEGSPGDYQGYDYLGFSTVFIPSDNMEPDELIQFADMLTLEDYSQHVDNVLKYTLALAERDGCKGVMISEFGALDEEALSEEEIARAYEIVLERGKDRVVGFIAINFLEVEMPGMPPVKELIKTTEVIKKWFTEVLPEKKMINY